MLDAGLPMTQVCRELNISELTYYRWRHKYGEALVDRYDLRELRKENRRLRELIADQALEIFDLRNEVELGPLPCRSWTPVVVHPESHAGVGDSER
jgi:putative transposase